MGCKVDLSRMTEAMSQLIRRNALQLLNGEPGIDEEEQVCSSSEVRAKLVKAIEVQKCRDAWEARYELPPKHMILPHILYHLSTNLGKKRLLRKARNVEA